MSDSKFSVEVRVDSGRTNVIPHAFIVLTDEFGNQQGYGFSPAKYLDLWGREKLPTIRSITMTIIGPTI